jgi:hypothetical protein
MQDIKGALQALKHESDSGQLYKPKISSGQAKGGASKVWIAIAAMVIVLAGVGTGGGIWWKRHKAAQAAALAAQQEEQQKQEQAAAAAAAAAAAPPPEPTPEPAPASPAETVLNNDNVIEMVDNKVPTSVIVSQIHSTKTDFNLSQAEVIRLSKAHVPAIVIETMRDPKGEHVVAATPKSTPQQPKSNPVQQASNSNPAPAPVTPAPITAAPPPIAPPVAPAATSTPKPTIKTVPSLLADGTPIQMTLNADVAADALEGTPLKFTVSSPVRTADGVVIAKGAVVTGEIVEAAKKKVFGTGKMQYRLTQADAADGTKLNVRATPAKSKEGPARRQMENPNQKHTHEIVAMAGAEYIGYVEGDQTVSVKK